MNEDLLAIRDDDGEGLAEDDDAVIAADDGQQPADSGVPSVQALLLDPELAVARDNFCLQHCGDIKEGASESDQQQLFHAYKEAMEAVFLTLQQQQQQGGPGAEVVTLQQLAAQVVQQQQAEGQGEDSGWDEEAVSLLQGVSSLSAFMALLEEFRQAEAGEAAGGGLSVQGSKAALHEEDEEQDEGQERPDLDGRGLSVTRLSVASPQPPAAPAVEDRD